LRLRRAVGTCMVQGYASLRVWVPKVSCNQWTTTQSLCHDLSECVFVYFGMISQKKWSVKMSLHHQKKIARAPRAPKCVATNVWCLLILTVYWAHGLYVVVTCHASHNTLVWVLSEEREIFIKHHPPRGEKDDWASRIPRPSGYIL